MACMTEQRLRERCRIVWLAADGATHHVCQMARLPGALSAAFEKCTTWCGEPCSCHARCPTNCCVPVRAGLREQPKQNALSFSAPAKDFFAAGIWTTGGGSCAATGTMVVSARLDLDDRKILAIDTPHDIRLYGGHRHYLPGIASVCSVCGEMFTAAAPACRYRWRSRGRQKRVKLLLYFVG